MIKILAILAVLVYFCEINGEIDRRFRRRFTSRCLEDVGSPRMKSTINTNEDNGYLNNDLGPLVVDSRRAKNITHTNEEEKTITKDSKSKKSKKKKKPKDNSEKLHSHNTRQDRKHRKDKNKKKEKGRNGKTNKHKKHTKKDNKHTEKNIHRDKHTSITKEKKNDHKTIRTGDKEKHTEKKKQAVDKNMDDVKISKVVDAVLVASRQPQSTERPSSTSKHSKPAARQGQSTNKRTKKPSSTVKHSKPATRQGQSTNKPSSTVKHSKPIRLVHNTMHDRQVSPRSHKGGKKIRGYRQGEGDGRGEAPEQKHIAYGKEEDVHGKILKPEKSQNPSHLSPYAIVTQMIELLKEFPDVNATITKFARTAEYNDIVLVSVSDNKNKGRYARAKDTKYIDEVPEKKIIFIVHGLTVMGMRKLSSMHQMSELKILFSYYFKHLDKFDFFIMPLANPDGYGVSGINVYWNKNMSPQDVCPGVFLDRNFDISWTGPKDMSSCSQLYPGAAPFSEVESKAVRDVFHYFSHKILAYIHVHPGTPDEKVFKGEAVLYPKGYTEAQSDDDKYIDLKGEIDEAMKNASFHVMSVTVDTLASWYGVISGSSVDYAASVYGIPYALEFAMQIYSYETMQNNALTQIWSRVIDTTFNNMWKSLSHGSEERKTH
ncbi:hypothetical protein PYW07_005771 [Mythimna separata]|uniref:Peptidase M14 domain-containing protein n=1 Tax=Mythimna separata TaxID=271217 RepID=A0AAD8DRL6_MYTSE|nr:hypothetical protein PYW07_005771 [Mythimna separata]